MVSHAKFHLLNTGNCVQILMWLSFLFTMNNSVGMYQMDKSCILDSSGIQNVIAFIV